MTLPEGFGAEGEKAALTFAGTNGCSLAVYVNGEKAGAADFNARRVEIGQDALAQHAVHLPHHHAHARRDGRDLLVRFAEQISEVSTLDKEPKMEGRSMSIFLSPKTGK